MHHFNWKKLSISAVLGYRWDGRRSRMLFQTRPDNYNAGALVRFLKHLGREFRHRQCVLIWDGLPAHKSRRVKAYLHEQRRWLTVERLPGYAPDLNPVEALWGNIKGQELANRCAPDLGDLKTAVRSGMTRVRKRRPLASSFLHHAGLFF